MAGLSLEANQVWRLTYEKAIETAAVTAYTETSRPRRDSVTPTSQATSTRADCTPADARNENQGER